jgi:hypothetical protein
LSGNATARTLTGSASSPEASGAITFMVRWSPTSNRSRS